MHHHTLKERAQPGVVTPRSPQWAWGLPTHGAASLHTEFLSHGGRLNIGEKLCCLHTLQLPDGHAHILRKGSSTPPMSSGRQSQSDPKRCTGTSVQMNEEQSAFSPQLRQHRWGAQAELFEDFWRTSYFCPKMF